MPLSTVIKLFSGFDSNVEKRSYPWRRWYTTLYFKNRAIQCTAFVPGAHNVRHIEQTKQTFESLEKTEKNWDASLFRGLLEVCSSNSSLVRDSNGLVIDSKLELFLLINGTWRLMSRVFGRIGCFSFGWSIKKIIHFLLKNKDFKTRFLDVTKFLVPIVVATWSTGFPISRRQKNIPQLWRCCHWVEEIASNSCDVRKFSSKFKSYFAVPSNRRLWNCAHRRTEKFLN